MWAGESFEATFPRNQHVGKQLDGYRTTQSPQRHKALPLTSPGYPVLALKLQAKSQRWSIPGKMELLNCDTLPSDYLPLPRGSL